jgi:hypothetical protein
MKWYLICLIVLGVVIIIGGLTMFNRNVIVDDLIPKYQKGIVSAIGVNGYMEGNTISPNHFSGWSYQITGNESKLYNLKSLSDNQICVIPKDISLKPITIEECDTSSISTSRDTACKKVNITYSYPTSLTQYDASASKIALTTKSLTTQKELDNSICFPLNEKLVSNYKIGEQSITLIAQYNYGNLNTIKTVNYSLFANGVGVRTFNSSSLRTDSRIQNLTLTSRNVTAGESTGWNFTMQNPYVVNTMLVANTTTVTIFCNKTNMSGATSKYYANITKVEIYDCGTSSTCAGGTLIYYNVSINASRNGGMNGNCNNTQGSKANNNLSITLGLGGGNYTMLAGRYLGIGIYVSAMNASVNINYNSTTLLSGFNITEIVNTSLDTNITEENEFAHLTLSDPNLVLYYPFDVNNDSSGIVYDYSSYNNDGNIFFSRYNSSGGKFGGENDFWNSSYISSNYGSSILENTSKLDDNITISAWVNFKGRTQPSYSLLVGKVGYNIGLIMESSTDISCGIITNESSAGAYSNYNVTGRENDWIYYACKVSKNGVQLYVDGNLISTSDPYTTILENENPLGIGGSTTYCLANLSIDEVMVFNRSLSATEIYTIYNSTYSRFYPNGEQKFTNLNFGTNNTVNISIANCQTLNGSSLNFKINDGSWATLTNCNYSSYSMSGLLTSANLTIQYNSTSLGFYSPIVAGNITLDSWTPSGADTCTYSGTGDWAINCADNCVISSPVTAGANSNLTIRGTGTFTTTANITGFKSGLSAGDGGLCTITCKGGGCFN